MPFTMDSGASFGSALPYLQLAMQVGSGLNSPGAAGSIADRFQQMAQSKGIDDLEMPSAPGILDKKKQAAAQIGEFALNAVPGVGPVASALLGAGRAAKTAGAAQDYIKKIFESNPELNRMGGHQFQSEYVPQSNWMANYAGSQPQQIQDVADKITHINDQMINNKYRRIAGDIASLGGNEIIHAVGKIVGGAKDKQAQRAEEIHKQNLEKFRALKERAQGQAAVQPALGRAYQAAFGMDPATQYLMQALRNRRVA